MGGISRRTSIHLDLAKRIGGKTLIKETIFSMCGTNNRLRLVCGQVNGTILDVIRLIGGTLFGH